MKLTLATCALGALGLTPALHGALGDPVVPLPQAPAAPAVAPAAPVVLPALAQALASTPLAPAAPAEPYVALLRQDSRRNIERDAAKLKSEIDRLRAELSAMQQELNGAKRAERKKAAKGQKAKKPEAGPPTRKESRRVINFTGGKPSVERVTVGGAAEATRAQAEALREFAETRRQRMGNLRGAVEGRVVRQGELRERAEEMRERAEEMREHAEERREEAMEHALEIREEAMEHAHEIREEAMEREFEMIEEAMERKLEAAEELHEQKVELHRVMIGHAKDGAKVKWITEGSPTPKWITKEGIKGKVFAVHGEPTGAHVFHMAPGSKSGHSVPAPVVTGSFRSGGHIDAGGPNSFNIHVEDGDVHIHTHGGSSIMTSKGQLHPGVVKGLNTNAKKNLFFGEASPGPHEADEHQVHLFTHVDAENGEKHKFEVNINGTDIDLSEILAGIGTGDAEFPMAIAVGALGELGGLVELQNLESLEGLIKLKDLENIKGLEALEALGALEGLEALGGNIAIDMDFDMEDLGELKSELGAFTFRLKLDEDCVEEEIEEEIEEEEVHETHDKRFVQGLSAPHTVDFIRPTQALPARDGFVLASQNSPLGNFPGTAPAAPTAEQQLLELARQIQADVQAMRAELDELRAEVLGAPRR